METTLPTLPSTSTKTGTDGIASALGGGSNVSDMFVKLLVAQIKNQNPLEPTDPSEFVGQLTQLSQMEALQKLTDQGSSSASMMSSMQMLALGAQVGSQVTVQTDKLQLGDQPVPISFTLGSNSTKNTLVLTASDGTETRVELGTRSLGDAHYTLDPKALGLAPGSYGMALVTASDEKPALQVTGTLSSVQLTGGGAAVMNVAGAGQVAPAAITGFNGRPAGAAVAAN
ncbi:MAG: flagellar basal body rod modification protein [Rhodoferax sp.]|nr:flagellar basal body rod modification protein [Rhodoferax sp.]